MNLEYESACKVRRLKSPIIAHNRQTRPEPRASNAWYMFTLKMQSLILKNAETVSYLSLCMYVCTCIHTNTCVWICIYVQLFLLYLTQYTAIFVLDIFTPDINECQLSILIQ